VFFSKKLIFIFLSILILFSNCATIIKGYESKVYVQTENSDIEILKEDSTKLSIFSDITYVKYVKLDPNTGEYRSGNTYRLFINLRSKYEHNLTIIKGDSLQKVSIYPKVGIGWVFLDIVTGVFPLVIDLYTGNLNYFDDIVVHENNW